MERLAQAEDNENAVYFLSAFLSAGRSLTAALELRYRRMYSDWRGTRTQPERTLLNFMTAERDDEVHEAGASRGVTICVPTIVLDRGTGTVSLVGSTASFITFDFAGNVQPAVSMCEEYLALLRDALERVCPEAPEEDPGSGRGHG